MKYAFVALALAAAVQAQTREDIPSCALPCLDDAVASESSCKTTDIPCICENFTKIRGAATSCILEKCGADVALNEVLPASEKLCAAAPGGGSSAAAATTTAVETTVAVTSTVAAVTSSTPMVTVSSVVSAPVSTVRSAVSTVVQSTPAGSASATPTPVPTGGAAALGSIGAVAMLFLGVLAL